MDAATAPLELHRNTFGGRMAVALLVIGPIMVVYALLVDSSNGWRFVLLAGGVLADVVGLVMFYRARRPFQFRVDAEGLTLRLPEHGATFQRLVPWHEVESVTLDAPERGGTDDNPPGPRLLLVPVSTSPLSEVLRERSQGSFELVELSRVKEAPDQIAAALAAFGGSRFVDGRPGAAAVAGPAAEAEEDDGPEFMIVLRGYDIGVVNELVRVGEDALATGGRFERMTAKSRIEATPPPVTTRGYDRGQVDAYLEKLVARLSA